MDKHDLLALYDRELRIELGGEGSRHVAARFGLDRILGMWDEALVAATVR